MKKTVSIFFTLVILLAGTHLTVATHFCGGHLAASKISLSGKLASCGMEGSKNSCPISGKTLNRHCCEDKATTAGTVNIFTDPVSLVKFSEDNNPKISYLTIASLFHSETIYKPLFTSVNPPGYYRAEKVLPEVICVFRI